MAALPRVGARRVGEKFVKFQGNTTQGNHTNLHDGRNKTFLGFRSDYLVKFWKWARLPGFQKGGPDYLGLQNFGPDYLVKILQNFAKSGPDYLEDQITW